MTLGQGRAAWQVGAPDSACDCGTQGPQKLAARTS